MHMVCNVCIVDLLSNAMNNATSLATMFELCIGSYNISQLFTLGAVIHKV